MEKLKFNLILVVIVNLIYPLAWADPENAEQGLEAMNKYIEQALDPKSTTPLFPEYESMMKCEFLMCMYLSESVGITPDHKRRCENFAEVLRNKTFKGSTMNLMNWHSNNKSVNKILNACPHTKNVIEKVEEKKDKSRS